MAARRTKKEKAAADREADRAAAQEKLADAQALVDSQKAAGRAILKRLQGVVNFRGDAEADQVCVDLEKELRAIRREQGGRHRRDDGGSNRAE